MSHNYHEYVCYHELRYCSKCDIAYCSRCDKEWLKKCESSHWLGSGYTYTVTNPYRSNATGGNTALQGNSALNVLSTETKVNHKEHEETKV